MDTKKFKIKSNGNMPKGGRNNTQTILTAAGVVSAGAAGLGYAAGIGEKDEAQVPVEEDPTQSQSQTTDQVDQAEQELQNSQTTNPEATSSTSGGGITEPQPTDSSQQQAAQNQQPSHEQQPVGNEISPEEVAQQIAQANEIDNNDIDRDDMLTVDGLTTAYAPDGTEMLVAVVHTPDGGQYLLADTDGDGIYSDVFDMEGNYVAEAEGNLTASDLEEMADETGGYLAQMDGEPVGDDPTNDIIDTINNNLDDSVDIADNDIISDEEEISDEELLAQLLSDEDDSDDLLAERLIDDEDDEEDADSSDDIDIDDDIDSDEV